MHNGDEGAQCVRHKAQRVAIIVKGYALRCRKTHNAEMGYTIDMTWRTHVAIGTNAIWLAGMFGQANQSMLVYLPVAVIASLLPDIDASSAKIHYAAGGVLGVFKNSFHGKYFHHRGLMHSLPLTLLFFIILIIIFHSSYPLLPYIFSLSYLSHSIIDGLNTGVGFLYPFVLKRFALVPRSLRSPVGGFADTCLLFVGLAGLLLFFAVYVHQIVPTYNPPIYP
jgi:membrane-bound metal-dependent hydrolase YbcI (DUF457 family)